MMLTYVPILSYNATSFAINVPPLTQLSYPTPKQIVASRRYILERLDNTQWLLQQDVSKIGAMEEYFPDEGTISPAHDTIILN